MPPTPVTYTIRTARGGRVRTLLAALLAGLAVALLAACDTSDAGEDDPLGLDDDVTATSSATTAIDPAAILGSLPDVQMLLEDAQSEFDSTVITDVDYEDGELGVTVSEDLTELEEAEALCNDLGEAVGMADLTIIVRNGSGAELAACTFQG